MDFERQTTDLPERQNSSATKFREAAYGLNETAERMKESDNRLAPSAMTHSSEFGKTESPERPINKSQDAAMRTAPEDGSRRSTEQGNLPSYLSIPPIHSIGREVEREQRTGA